MPVTTTVNITDMSEIPEKLGTVLEIGSREIAYLRGD